MSTGEPATTNNRQARCAADSCAARICLLQPRLAVRCADLSWKRCADLLMTCPWDPKRPCAHQGCAALLDCTPHATESHAGSQMQSAHDRLLKIKCQVAGACTIPIPSGVPPWVRPDHNATKCMMQGSLCIMGDAHLGKAGSWR